MDFTLNGKKYQLSKEHVEQKMAGVQTKEGHEHFVVLGGRKYPVRQVLSLLKRANLPDAPYHSLRHTSASLLLLQGVHRKVVQERLGHSDVGITLNIYSHVTPSMGREAAERLDALLA